MYQVLTCVSEHDLRLVLVAGVICGLASLSAIGLFQRRRRAQDGDGWLALAAAVAGAGVWATHFVAVLAFEPGAPMAFAVGGTIASLVFAIIGSGMGFVLALGGPVRRALGGAVVGLSFSGMHFAGILSVEMPARVDWQAGYVVASIVLSAALSAASLVVLGRGTYARRAAASLLLTLAILSLHFTAMTALTVVPDPTVALASDAVSRTSLAGAVALVALILVITPYALLRLEQRTQRRTFWTLRRSLDVMPGGMAFFDDRDTLIAWNEAYATMARGIGVEPREGVKREALMNAALTAGWGSANREDDPDLVKRMRAWKGEFSTDSLGPGGRWLRHKQFPLPDGGGVVTLTDITAEKEFLSALTAAKEDAEAASVAKSAFLANMSHEIRTPLNGLLGAAQLLSQRSMDPEARELVDMLNSSGRVLSELLSDLLDLSRLDARAIDLRPEPTEVTDLIAKTRRVFAPSAMLKGLDLVVQLGEGAGGFVMCDRVRVLQVLGNLVGNAIKFTDQGRVTLMAERKGDRLVFCVADTGVGFDPAQKERLFQRFVQADASLTRVHGGAGLGLAISAELVALMGGEIEAASAEGQGTTFIVSLPLPALTDPGFAADVTDGDQQTTVIGEGRVLIVDDNETNRRVLATILNAGGLEHAEARDGAEALEVFSRQPFSAVLMDLQMPVMDGLEATRRIRDLETAGGRNRTPIFVVSANCLQEHVTASLAAGADDHFGKPVSVPELLGALAPHVEAAVA